MDFNYLYQYIPVGIENAIHQQDLAARLNTTPAAAKNIVRQARQQGLQILSGVNGYWFAADENEKQAFVRLMQKQAFSRLKTASPIKNTLKQIQGQMNLTDVMNGVSEETSNNEQEQKAKI
jgi:biotin operon repressor